MVKETFVVGDNAGVKIEKFLKILGFSYLTGSQLIRKGNVKVNGKRQKASCILQLGDVVEIFAVVQSKIDKKVIPTKKHKEIDKNIRL